MIIKEQTISALASKGVNVRWYPEATYQEFSARMLQKDTEEYVRYYKDHVAGCEAVINGYANVCYNSMDELRAAAENSAQLYNKRHCSPYEYNVLYIEYDGKLIMKKENVKSKEITPEYVAKLIEKNEKAYAGYYGTFALNMQKLLKANGLDNKFSVYPTTYGIGIWVIYNWNADKDISRVTALLDTRAVEYYNEYSEHGWVYRFKVSKRADNLARVAA